jgi:hypothetical protein
LARNPFLEKEERMDKRFTDLTREGRIRLRDFLLAHAEKGEEVVAIKEVPVEGRARVAFEEGELICVSPVFVVEATKKEIWVCHAWDTEGIVLCPDYPCIVRV